LKKANYSALALFLFLSGCAGSPVSMNPDYDFKQVKNVAVLGFEPAPRFPESASTFTVIFEKLLLQAGYRLVERQEVKKVLGEQNFSMSGAVDPKQAIELGRILGVDALILGSATLYNPHETGVRMVEIRTVTREPVIIKQAVQVNRGGKTVTEYVDVVGDYRETMEKSEQPQVYRIQAEAGAVVKMVDAKTGVIAWVGNTSEEGYDVQSASEMVGRRIVNSLKKVWPISLAKKN
jgi:hypothetical protein